MTSYWDIDDMSGDFDDDGNLYQNQNYRITPEGDIEHFGDDGWEVEPHQELHPDFDD